MNGATGSPNSEEHLLMVTATGNIGLWSLDIATGHAWRNLSHDQIFGYDEMLPEWTYEIFLDHVLDEDRPEVERLYSDAVQNAPHWSFECRIRRTDGEIRWISAHGQRFGKSGSSEERLIGHVLDITRLKSAEDRLRLVSQEQSHRLANMLAVIEAMTRSTVRGAADLAEFEEVFLGRLRALVRSHAIFSSEGGGEGLSLARLLADELQALATPGRVSIRGAEGVRIEARHSDSLAMTLHELLTNALKYGALSGEAGRILIEVQPLRPGFMELVWTERGGPEVVPPARRGFGTRLLLAGGTGGSRPPKLDYHPEGVRCSIEFAAVREPATA